MGIHLRRLDAPVSERHLDGPEIFSLPEKICSECVAKHVVVEMLLQPRFSIVLSNHLTVSVTGQPSSFMEVIVRYKCKLDFSLFFSLSFVWFNVDTSVVIGCLYEDGFEYSVDALEAFYHD